MDRRNQKTRERGETLPETLVFMTILLVAGASSLSLFTNATRVFSRETVTAALQTDAAAAVHVFADDVSVAGFSPDGVAGPSALATFQSVTTGTSSDRVSFIGDIDSDGVSDLVTYELSSGTLTRRIEPRAGEGWSPGATQVLVTGVAAMRLVFRDARRTPITSGFDATSTLQIILTLETPAKGGTVTRTLFRDMAIRNG